MAPTKAVYIFTFNPTSEQEEKTTAEALRILLCCRWSGSDFIKTRNVPPSEETGGLPTVSYEWTQTKFFVGLAKVTEALGSLADQVKIYNVSDGLTLQDILAFNTLKRKYEVPDILTEREEERSQQYAGAYGKRPVSLPIAGTFVNSWVMGRECQPCIPIPRNPLRSGRVARQGVYGTCNYLVCYLVLF